MKRTPIEGSSKTLSAIGLGCSRIGSFGNPLSSSDVRLLLAAAFDSGVSVFDTSDVYGQGDSERELGRFLAGKRRTEAFVVTKAGKLFSRKMQLLRPFKPLLKPLLSRRGRGAITARRSDEISHDFSPAHILAAVEGSLRRLRTDTLDGFLLHSPPASAVSQHALWETLARLKDSGKIATFGVSCDTKEVLEASLKVPGATLLQLPYDVLTEIENSDIAAEIARMKMVVLAREVIRFQPEIAPEKAIRNAGLMPLVSTVIVGTTKIPNLQSAIAAISAS
jgi:aryl-alcohol dehydrogenase-like predicted oxidoreductase